MSTRILIITQYELVTIITNENYTININKQ